MLGVLGEVEMRNKWFSKIQKGFDFLKRKYPILSYVRTVKRATRTRSKGFNIQGSNDGKTTNTSLDSHVSFLS